MNRPEDMQNSEEIVYKIGSISKITGICTETLRAWERRYSAVEPDRSESGDRIYMRRHVTKLLLLKNLVDCGIQISSIAKLSTDELQKRWDEIQPQMEADRILAGSESHQSQEDSENVCKVALIGEGFSLRVIDGIEDFERVKVIGHADHLEEWEKLQTKINPHVVIAEIPVVNEKSSDYIHRILHASGAWHVIVMYGFGTQDMIARLQGPQVTMVRSSLDVYELVRLCVDRSGGDSAHLQSMKSSTLYYEETIPARRYSAKQLAAISGVSPTIACECPHHLTELVKSLVAFEIYSAECENRTPKDAEMHTYLHATTAQARSLLEDALAHVVAHEKIMVA